MSSFNPFRSEVAITPNATGASAVPSLDGPPPSFRSTESLTAAPASSTHATTSPPEDPPPYTPSADPATESTVEFGPARAFQPPPPPGQSPYRPQRTPANNHSTGNIDHSQWPLAPQSTGNNPNRLGRPSLLRNIVEQLTGAAENYVAAHSGAQMSNTNTSNSNGPTGWSAYPGSQQSGIRPQQTGRGIRPQQTGTSFASQSGVVRAVPPRHPSQPPLPPRPDSSTNVPTPSSDFARDFYAAGPEMEVTTPNSSSAFTQSYAPPSGPPPTSRQPRYAPPPGQPPPLRPVSAGDVGRQRSLSATTSHDGPAAPTTKPTPGHPLLNEGRLLVYPGGFECSKCNNTGYKFDDPLNPCKKCWGKYAKPFEGALKYAYGPEASEASTSSSARNTKAFQRPLRTAPSANRNASQPILSRSLSHPPRTCATNSPAPPPQPQSQIYASTGHSHAPRNALVLLPGDPRIGGRLCWKCRGSGQVSFMIFDEIACGVCGGVGRIF